MAAGSLGAANAIINWRSAGDEVDYAVNDSGAKVLVVGTELMPVIDRIRDRLTRVEKIIEARLGAKRPAKTTVPPHGLLGAESP